MENQKNIIIGVLVVAVIVGAYFLGKNDSSKISPTPTQTASSSQQTAPEKPASSVSTNTLSQDGTNGLNCKNVAEAAARNSQRADTIVIVTRSNFSKTYSKCYYEVNIKYTSGGMNDSTELHVAPNDEWIAQCTTGVYPAPQKFCTKHNTFYPETKGPMPEEEYDRIAAQYLTN